MNGIFPASMGLSLIFFSYSPNGNGCSPDCCTTDFYTNTSTNSTMNGRRQWRSQPFTVIPSSTSYRICCPFLWDRSSWARTSPPCGFGPSWPTSTHLMLIGSATLDHISHELFSSYDVNLSAIKFHCFLILDEIDILAHDR